MIFSSLIFKENHVFTEEKDNSSNKVAIVEAELDVTDVDDIGNLVGLNRLMFINEECRNLRVVVDQGRSQNLKQGPQDFIKTFCVDDVMVTSQLMTPYRKINIASKKIINYCVSSPSNHYCCQINIIAREFRL